MLKDSYKFSAQGMRALRDDIKQMRQNIQTTASKVEDTQIEDFEGELRRASPSDLVYSIDTVRTSKFRAIVEQSGSQVIFTEFGTGWVGLNSPRHPQEGETKAPDGDPYQVNKTGKDESGWSYIGADGQAKWTQGEPAGMQNYKAFEYIKRRAYGYAKLWLEGVKR